MLKQDCRLDRASCEFRILAVVSVVLSVFSFAPNLPAEDFSGLREINPPASPDESRVVAIVGGTLIDGTGSDPIADSVVIVRGDKIEAAGSRATIEIPAEATQFDAVGLTVLPGLIDAHFHTATGESILSIPPLFLSHGVTTARDPGRPIDVYDPYRTGKLQAPRLFLTGPHYDQEPPAWPLNAIVIRDEAHARQATQDYVRQGATGIKVYYRLPLAEIKATCETAHALGIPVTAHLELVDADQAILAGLDGIEHITSFGTVLAGREIADEFRTAVNDDNAARQDGRYRLWATLNLEDSPQADKLLKLIVEKGVVVSPTLATFERRAGDKNVQEFQAAGFANMLKFVGMCHRAGATVVTGSHTWSPKVDLGWAYQREMELLIECGLSPMDVIKASTINNAKFLGCADRLGSIEAGKRADLVFVEGDPLRDIKAMYDVRRVMQNGHWIEPK